jgi:ribosome biogenesis GTPase / thiamine phosphate phosphatase
VKNAEGRLLQARIKGKFKIDEITSTNPVVVGDVVDLEIENQIDYTATITAIHDRENYINRQSPSRKFQHHIIAANIDQSLLIATLKEPRTSQGFIDRFVIACEAYHVKAILVFNKSDLYHKKEMQRFHEWKEMYENVGYKVVLMSVKQNEGVAELDENLRNKVTLLSGHSGVGKSTFINAIVPEMELKTQDVSGWSGKGLHTTTFAEMFDLPSGGQIIDTPGMREFGLVDISKQELSHYFPEMRDLLQDCQFNNCLHVNEPGCAIKDQVDGSIHILRYISYLNILESIGEKTY